MGAERVRLQKYLSDAGVASRRAAEELIVTGRVLVNDAVVDELPAFVDPKADRVIVNGVPVRPQRLEYYILNKPKGVVCTPRDPQNRQRAIDLLPPQAARLLPVGWLDPDSSGLLLMTNDGELAERLTHARYGVARIYQVEVRGQVPTDLVERLKVGVHLAEGRAAADDVELLHATRERSALRITLRGGRNRQIQRMLAKLGFKARRLQRVQLGPLRLEKLPVGAARRLAPREVDALRAATDSATRGAERTPRRGAARGRTRVARGAKRSEAAQTDKGPRRRIIR